MSDASKPTFSPYRFTIYWCSSEESQEAAEISFGSVEDWIERGGGFVQGGSIERMKDEDIVPDSPLDLDLRGVRDGK